MSKSNLAMLIEQEVKKAIHEADDFQRGNRSSSDHCTDCGGEEYEGETGELKMFYFGGDDVSQGQPVDICQNCYTQRKSGNPNMNTSNESKDKRSNPNQIKRPANWSKENEVDYWNSSDDSQKQNSPKMDLKREATPKNTQFQSADSEEENPQDMIGMEEPDADENNGNSIMNQADNEVGDGNALRQELMSLSDLTKQAAESMGEDGGEEEVWVASHINAAKELLSHVADYFQTKGGDNDLEASSTETDDTEPEGDEMESPEGEEKEQGNMFERLMSAAIGSGINEQEIPRNFIREKNTNGLASWIQQKRSGKNKIREGNPFRQDNLKKKVKESNGPRPESERMREKSRVINKMADIQKRFEDETGTTQTLSENKVRQIRSIAKEIALNGNKLKLREFINSLERVNRK